MSITVITGPPGAGKTTVAAALAGSRPLGVHLVADQCFHWIVSGLVAPWTPESDRQNRTVIGVVGGAAAAYAAGGYDVYVDGIVGPWFLDQFRRAVGPVGPLRYVVLRPMRQVAQRRALGREGPQDLTDPGPVDAMYHAFIDLGAFESHVVDTSGHEPAFTVAVVRRGLDDGRFVLTGTGGTDAPG